MKKYFVEDGWYANFIQSGAIDDADKAMKLFEEISSEQPVDLFCFDDETGLLYEFDCKKNAFVPCSSQKIYIVVRRLANVNYHETVVCEDGIFDKFQPAEDFAKKHNGTWKLYNYRELLNKMNESEIVKIKEEPEELPF